MYGYICFYKGQKLEVLANTSFEAQQIAAEILKAKKTWQVAVELAENPDGSPVIHHPMM